jgi:hypothetical protein
MADTENGTAAKSERMIKGMWRGMEKRIEEKAIADGSATGVLTEDGTTDETGTETETEAESGVEEALSIRTTGVLQLLRLLRLHGRNRKICTPTDKGWIGMVGPMVAGVSTWRGTSASIEIRM